jgi:hypothetical protein
MTSLQGARHVANLQRSPRVAICVDVEASEPTANGVRPNAAVRAWGLASLAGDADGYWTRRITLKYVPGEIGAARADYRARMERVVIELRPLRLVSTANVERLSDRFVKRSE